MCVLLHYLLDLVVYDGPLSAIQLMNSVKFSSDLIFFHLFLHGQCVWCLNNGYLKIIGIVRSKSIPFWLLYSVWFKVVSCYTYRWKTYGILKLSSNLYCRSFKIAVTRQLLTQSSTSLTETGTFAQRKHTQGRNMTTLPLPSFWSIELFGDQKMRKRQAVDVQTTGARTHGRHHGRHSS